MKIGVLGAALTATVASALSAHASVQEIDISPYVNAAGPAGDTNYGQYAGNAGSGVTFNLLAPDSNGNNTWLGVNAGDQLTIPVDLTGVSTVYTLLNTRYGQPGSTNTQVTFNTSAGFSITYNLKGGNDIRDYNPFIYTNTLTNTIGNPTAVNFWSSNGDGTGTRQDLQTFQLPTQFMTDELTTIVITNPAGGGIGTYQPLLAGIDYSLASASAAPEPATWSMLIVGVGGVGSMLRRAKKVVGSKAGVLAG